jgi:hypothetical protein
LNADLSGIATALSTIALAVVVAAGRAFPGWGSDIRSRILRAVVLVPSIAFFTIAAAAANTLAVGLAVHTPAGAEDVQFFRGLLALGAFTLAVLFLAGLFATDPPAQRRPIRSFDAVLITCFALFVGLSTTLDFIRVLDNTVRTLIAICGFVAIFIAAETAYEVVTERTRRRAEATTRRRIVRHLENVTASGLALQGCTLRSARSGRELTHGWTTTGPRSRTHVWLEIAAVRALVDATHHDLIAAEPTARRVRCEIRTATFASGLTLAVHDVL